jgi:hypothetical protein
MPYKALVLVFRDVTRAAERGILLRLVARARERERLAMVTVRS